MGAHQWISAHGSCEGFEQEGAQGRATMTWGALNGQPLISLAADNSTQQLIEQ
jgi:hypothetical protein